MDPITVVGNTKPFDRNPNSAWKLVATCRVHGGIPIGLIEEALSAVSSDAYLFKPNNSSPFSGQIVNLYCNKTSVTKDAIDSFLFDVNVRLDALLDARKGSLVIGPGGHTKGTKPRPRRIAPQRRRG